MENGLTIERPELGEKGSEKGEVRSASRLLAHYHLKVAGRSADFQLRPKNKNAFNPGKLENEGIHESHSATSGTDLASSFSLTEKRSEVRSVKCEV